MDINWQLAFNQLVTGLYLLTTCHEDKVNGMIVSWATQVSYDPPMILVAVHPNRYSHHLIQKSNHFALHVLENTQKELIERMQGSDPKEKFKDIYWQTSQTGCPLINDCLAWFECRVTNQFQPGNHTLFTGQVINAKLLSSGTSLSTFDYKNSYIGRS